MTLSAARRDPAHMKRVFNSHAQPLGLSAKALASALHAIRPSSFSADVSDADAKKLMKGVDIGNKGHVTFEELCQTAQVSFCDGGADASSARREFLRCADVKALSAPALIAALKEVDAPVLLSGEGCSPEQIFRRADADISGSVDLAEFDSHNSPLFSPPTPPTPSPPLLSLPPLSLSSFLSSPF